MSTEQNAALEAERVAFEAAYAVVVDNGWTNVKHMGWQVWQQARAQLAAPDGVDDPTHAMVLAGEAQWENSGIEAPDVAAIYRAMRAAAPSPAPASDVVQVPRDVVELSEMLERLADTVEDLNDALLDAIDDDMEDPDSERELCDEVSELVADARALQNGGRV